MDEYVSLYVKMRDTLAARTKEYEDYKKTVKAKMEKVEGLMLSTLNETGAESIRTESGTVYKQTKMLPSIRDFTALSGWMLQTGNLDVLQRRISTTAMKVLVEDGVEVPGVEVVYETEVGVRRA